ncbi:hypothetical protein ABI59_02155 [Acidobacteria bacterium Mor1]|nr:hypothetical protein ABI59_02155 [Acidobacteria bacterium Mor1]
MLAGCLVLPAAAATIYVDVANQTGFENGSDILPYNTIQEGVDNAQPGDLVMVAAGTYAENVVMREGIDVQGAGPGVTIIDGTGIEASVVTFDTLLPGPTLSGFTITGGQGDVVGDVAGVEIIVGGGIRIRNSSPTITRNLITGNLIEEGYARGGGIYVYTIGEAPKISENVISGNLAVSGELTDQGEGGAIYVKSKNSDALILDNLIENNEAVDGGGIYVENSATSGVLIERNRIRLNVAADGGGVFATGTDDSFAQIRNNLVESNGTTAGAGRGGGFWLEAQDQAGFSVFHNTLVENEVSGGQGGALWLDDRTSSGTTEVGNNVIAGNSAMDGGGIDHTLFDGAITVNGLFDNTGGDFFDGGGSGATLLDNISADPFFIAPGGGNFRLGAGSLLIDAADESAAPSEDLDGFLRPYDGDADLTGSSDIGAYEYPGGEVFSLIVDGDSLTWQLDGEADAYHLYRGSLAVLAGSGSYIQDPATEPLAAQFCELSGGDLPFADSYIPPVNEGVFYLVTLRVGGWEGPLGIDSGGGIRPGGVDCTP